MDLTYPAEAEEFRAEIRSWLEANLPADWGQREMTGEHGGQQRGVPAGNDIGARAGGPGG